MQPKQTGFNKNKYPRIVTWKNYGERGDYLFHKVLYPGRVVSVFQSYIVDNELVFSEEILDAYIRTKEMVEFTPQEAVLIFGKC